MTARHRGLVLAALLTAALAACFASGFFWNYRWAELMVSAGWSLAVLGGFAGWGLLVARVCWPGQSVGIALRSVWGGSFLIFLGGVLASVSLLGGKLMIAMIAVGCALQAHAWIKGADDLDWEARVRIRATRLYPALACLALFCVAAVLVRYAGGAADFQSNPYDDDVAYHLFTKQLVERGTLIDPFSFRRMSTLGGQSFCHALLHVRVPIFHMNVFDRAMCILMSCGMLASQRVDGRLKPPFFARAASVLFLVSMPFTGINSASFYSGVAWFLGLYMTAELLPGEQTTDIESALRRVAPLALVGAAACTLRQNYQTQVALFIVVAYAFALLAKRRQIPWRKLPIEPVVAIALVGLFVLPWLFLMYRSSDTFLFPLQKGTLRPGVTVTTSDYTPGKIFRFFLDVWLTPDPLYALPFFALGGLAVRDRAAMRPVASVWIAGFFSITMLAVGFTMADAGNLERYDFGFLMPAALFTWQTVALRAMRGQGRWRAAVPAAICFFALGYTLETNVVRSRKMWDGLVKDTEELLRRTIPPQREPPIAGAYHRLQDSVPAQQPILIMLDQPFYMDYRRNPLVNLDMPGMASPWPGIPCFKGPEPVAAYLKGLGLRYVAFVEEERSTFLYRRDVWLQNTYHHDEFWRINGPYLIDVMDNLEALAKTRKHLHDEAGMIVLDLETPAPVR